VFTALVLAIAAATGAADRHPQHDVVASSHARDVQAALGSHCTPSNGAMVCVDRTYPLETKGRLPVHARGRIVLEFRVPPEEIDPQLRDKRSRPVRELTAKGNGLVRTIRLPRVLPPGSDRLGVFVGYERGDADFEIDLRRHRH
jgi:hypothetical protein